MTTRTRTTRTMKTNAKTTIVTPAPDAIVTPRRDLSDLYDAVASDARALAALGAEAEAEAESAFARLAIRRSVIASRNASLARLSREK